ncbi:MAG: hypothetical protein ACO3RN_06795, partial [Ilumatobacteraceae bacterium]
MKSRSKSRSSNKRTSRRATPSRVTPVFDIASLQRFLDDSPTPHHVVASAARLLLDACFTWFDERSEFPDFSGAVVMGI